MKSYQAKKEKKKKLNWTRVGRCVADGASGGRGVGEGTSAGRLVRQNEEEERPSS